MLSGLLCTLESCLFLKLCLWNQPTQTSRSVAPQPPCAPGSSASGSPQGRAGPGTRRSGCPGPPASLWSLAAEWPLFTLLTEASDLADKNTACPVNFEFQTNNEYILAEVCHVLVSVRTKKKSILCLSKINIKLKGSMFSLAILPGVKQPWLQYQVDDYLTVWPWAS